MIRSIFFTLLVVIVSLLTTAAFGQGDNYLPLIPGLTNRYANVDDHHTLILRYLNQVGPTQQYVTDFRINGVLSESIAMTLSNDGDGNIYCSGGCWCPTQLPCRLEPSELMIQVPLDVGRGWETNCISSAHGPMHISSQVLRFEKVKVPAGTFESFLVERRITTWAWTYCSLEWYSNKVGIVKFYWPWAGTFVLLPRADALGPNMNEANLKSDELADKDTWGGVKALYR